MNRDKLKNVLVEFLKEEHFQDVRVEFKGTSGATDGYLGDINFASIACVSKDGTETNMDLVIKSGKKMAGSIAAFEEYVKMYFNQEIIMYTKIFPTFRQFELENDIKGYFEAIPRCYKCIDEEQIIILDNLKAQRYEVHDRKIPLSWAHLKLILQDFGKFHAVSFAFEHKKEQEYHNLIKNLVDVDKKSFSDKLAIRTFLGTFNNLSKILQERKQTELYTKINKILENDLHQTVVNLLSENSSHKIVSHVDAWNNNFMFLCDQDQPVKAKIIDWQMSTVRNSPVYDLSHFLYSCSSPEDLDRLEELLKIYHSSLSTQLRQFGCDPETIFSFNTLKEHWRKFSIVGFWFVPYVIKQCYWNDEDAKTMEQENDVEWGDLIEQIVIKDENYYERLIGVVKHFFNYKFSQ